MIAAQELFHIFASGISQPRAVGLPASVAVQLVGVLKGGSDDAEYARGLIRVAIDTDPALMTSRAFHDITHAPLDPKGSPLSAARRGTPRGAAVRWLVPGTETEPAAPRRPARAGEATNEACVRRLSGITGSDAAAPDQLHEEAVAQLGEVALVKQIARAIRPKCLSRMNASFASGDDGGARQRRWSRRTS